MRTDFGTPAALRWLRNTLLQFVALVFCAIFSLVVSVAIYFQAHDERKRWSESLYTGTWLTVQSRDRRPGTIAVALIDGVPIRLPDQWSGVDQKIDTQGYEVVAAEVMADGRLVTVGRDGSVALTDLEPNSSRSTIRNMGANYLMFGGYWVASELTDLPRRVLGYGATKDLSFEDERTDQLGEPAGPDGEKIAPASDEGKELSAAPSVADETIASVIADEPVSRPVASTPSPTLLAELDAAVKSGNAKAQFLLGVYYAEGRGVVKDDAKALLLATSAAQQGLVMAQYRLGAMYERGISVQKDLVQATYWYNRAAQGGNRKAMHNLGVLYADGVGIGQRFELAAKLFRRGAESGISDSQYNLAILLERGMGVEQNLEEAAKWYAIAASQGDTGASEHLRELRRRLDPSTYVSAERAARGFLPAFVPEANDIPAWPSQATNSPPGRPPSSPINERSFPSTTAPWGPPVSPSIDPPSLAPSVDLSVLSQEMSKMRGLAAADAGVARLNDGEATVAIALFTRAIQSKELNDERLALTYYHRGMAFYRNGAPGRAVLDYSTTLWDEALPKEFRPRALNNRGLAFEQLSDFEAALRDYNLALRLSPTYATAYANRGNVRRRLGQNDLALIDYRAALQNNHPQPAYVHTCQGLSLEALGDREAAAVSYRKALSIDASYSLAKNRLRALGSH